MHTLMLQDWTTIRGAAATGVTQSANAYLDLEPYESFVAWIETRDLELGGATDIPLALESAPLKEEALFAATNLNFINVSLVLGVQTATNLLNAPYGPNQRPLSRWLRWRLDGSGATSAWTVTFRILIAAYSPLA